MHEQGIAQEIIKEATKHGTVKAITVEVGDLAHLPRGEMEQVLKKMTPWEIKTTSKKATIKCTCGYVGEPHIVEHGHDHSIFECPKCKAAMPQILEGKDIILKDVEVE